MMKKKSLLFVLIILCSAQTSDKNCIKGDIEYSISNYKEDFEPHYARLFNHWFQRPLLDFLCHENIKNLPSKDLSKRTSVIPSKRHVIEPLFVELSTFDGIYGTRIYSLELQARNPRFTCGYFHYLFILSNREYIALKEDSLANTRMIEEKLSGSFTQQEIDSMKAYCTDHTICTPLSLLPPAYVKQKDAVLYDAAAIE